MDFTPEQLRYPIGKYTTPENITQDQISAWIDEINAFPAKLRITVSGLNDRQLNTPYREEGWTLRQVVHHLADSHMNAYIRYKLAITEQEPVIRPYDEKKWAECEEAKTADIDISLALIDTLHKRWVLFLRSLKYEDFERTYIHPEHNKVFSLKNVTGMYVWHGDHHLHHILQTIERNNW
ncbi:MAG TPA: putative metal-dependent hydrolase [Sphingobacteriaceae bacterium]|nr:putative metal-dependent hydrolase [Sphingobacteriaceae bacterium]